MDTESVDDDDDDSSVTLKSSAITNHSIEYDFNWLRSILKMVMITRTSFFPCLKQIYPFAMKIAHEKH